MEFIVSRPENDSFVLKFSFVNFSNLSILKLYIVFSNNALCNDVQNKNPSFIVHKEQVFISIESHQNPFSFWGQSLYDAFQENILILSAIAVKNENLIFWGFLTHEQHELFSEKG